MNSRQTLIFSGPLVALAAIWSGPAFGQPIPGVSERYGGLADEVTLGSASTIELNGETLLRPALNEWGEEDAGLGSGEATFAPQPGVSSVAIDSLGRGVPGTGSAIGGEMPPLPEEPRIEFVDERIRDELEPLGLRVGSFRFFPEVEGAIEYTDNVFASGPDRVDDVAFVTRPLLVARSDWNRHWLEITYSGEYGSFVEYATEDPRETRLQAAGRLDIAEATALAGVVSFAAEQEGRGDIEASNAASEPTENRTLAAAGEASHRISRLTVALRGGVSVEDYDNAVDALGATINNNDRDVTITDSGYRLTYELSPATSVYGDGAYRLRDHDQSLDDDGFARDSKRWTMIVGLAFEPTPLLRGEIAVGRVVEELDDVRLAAIDDFTVDSALKWSVTPLTTISLGYATMVDATSLADASASLTRTASVAVDHELLRQLVVSSGVAYEMTDYQGIALDEETVTAQVGAEYWINRSFALVARYTHENQTSSEVTQPQVVENTMSVGIKMRR